MEQHSAADVSKKIDEKKISRRFQVSKNLTRDQRKIPLILLLMLLRPTGLASKTVRRESYFRDQRCVGYIFIAISLGCTLEVKDRVTCMRANMLGYI